MRKCLLSLFIFLNLFLGGPSAAKFAGNQLVNLLSLLNNEPSIQLKMVWHVWKSIKGNKLTSTPIFHYIIFFHFPEIHSVVCDSYLYTTRLTRVFFFNQVFQYICKNSSQVITFGLLFQRAAPTTWSIQTFGVLTTFLMYAASQDWLVVSFMVYH